MLKIIVSVFLTFTALFTTLQGYFRKPGALTDGGIRVHYAEGSSTYMDIYFPNDVQKEADVVLIIHGGSWMSGDQTMFTAYAKQAADYGLVGVTVDYGKLTEKKTVFDMEADIFAAVAKLRDVLSERGIAADKMIVAGHSSGSHLALLYAYKHYKESPIEIGYVAAFSSPADLTLYVNGNTALEKSRALLLTAMTRENITTKNLNDGKFAELIARINPYDLVTADVPPTLLAHGDADDVVPYENSVRLYAKLQANGVDTAFLTYEGQGHFLRYTAGDMQQTRIDTMLRWAEKYL